MVLRSAVLIVAAALVLAAAREAAGTSDERDVRDESVQSALRLLNATRAVGPRHHPEVATVLAYVTPWNKAVGYELAVKFAGKVITHVSPAWYDVETATAKEGGSGKKKAEKAAKQEIVVKGESNFNKTFVEALVSRGATVLPRFRFGLGVAALSRLLERKGDQTRFVEALRPIFVRHNAVYGGLVIDCPNLQFKAPHQERRVAALLAAIRSGLEGVLGKPPQIAVVIPADHDLVGPTEIAWLAPLVDHISLMTYDFNKAPRPGFLAPVGWVEQIAGASMAGALGARQDKMLVGIPFYGYSYGGVEAQQVRPSPITATDYEKLLRAALQRERLRLADGKKGDASTTKIPRIPLQWDSEAGEHVVEVYVPKKGVQIVYYPTRAFVQERLLLAKRFGAGVSIWELGQGMEAFLHLF